MDSISRSVLPGTFFRCSEKAPNALEIDYASIAAMTEEDKDNLSLMEYRFLEWVVFEEIQMKGQKSVFHFEQDSPNQTHIFDRAQSEICEILLEYLGIPLPTE